MYLVIKNGTQKKSYQCTNTCNKPRVRVGSSYIPLTNNIQSKPKCKINSMEIASYKSYTYTANKGTVTTGTTYLTRGETTGTTYQTRASTYNTVYQTAVQYAGNSIVQTVKNFYGTFFHFDTAVYMNGSHVGGTTYGSQSYIIPGILTTSSDDPDVYFYTASIYTSRTSTLTIPPNKRFIYSSKATSWTYSIGTGSNYTYNNSYTSLVSGSVTYNTAVPVYQTATTNTIYETRASTYNTLYGTRASTSGTSYGTKTTNKTLTSSSWG